LTAHTADAKTETLRMTENKFLEIIDKILLPVIDEMVGRNMEFKTIGENLRQIVRDSKKTIHKEYESKKNLFKKNYFAIKRNAHIDRFKIAALIYIAFVKVMKDSKFLDRRDKKLRYTPRENNKCLDRKEKTLKYLLAHRVAFNTAIIVIENFICANEKTHGASYCSHVKEHGIVEQTSEETGGIISKLIYDHRRDALSEFAVANIFYSIECGSKIRFEKHDESK
jgi:hypothetical protein